MRGAGNDSRAKDLVEQQGQRETGYNVDPQPAHATECGAQRKMLLLFELFNAGTGYFGKIFRLLFVDYIDYIIDGHESHEVILLIDDRHSQQVIPGNDPRHLFLVGIGLNFNHILVHKHHQLCTGFGHHQFAQRNHAHQPLLLIHDIQVVDHLEVIRVAPQVSQGFFNGQMLIQRQHLGGHDASGSLRAVAQQVADRLRFVGRHQAQQAFGLLLWNVRQNVGGVIGGQQFQHIGGAFRVEFAQNLVLAFRLDLVQDVGSRFGIHVFKHSACLFHIELFEDIGDVSRVQVGQFGMADIQLHLRHHASRAGSSYARQRGSKTTGSHFDDLNRLDIIPGNGALRKVYWEDFAYPLDGCENAQPAQQAAEADIRADQPGGSLDLCQLQVVDLHNTKTLCIDNLLIQ